ncbi:hypothetical protein PRIPAC_91011 [Pristionchus pacificus]|uniref:Uncharacterized protein n=1 Tax=Pristionchus pacificus TaxID=54126 RepID=A0A2A6B6L5_PRIPA|nr:hypothetical protein PRIPAC_91011 [Pristionchus pacificus]|eukprot:PDM61525.1 hypothetical protein PRIPAC_50967 [Pristionchus pacificus]
MLWMLIAGCCHLTAALPALDTAPKLTLDELVGAGTFAPPTLAPELTATDWEIPPNPEAWKPNPPKGIPLPVFDPTVKFEGPEPENSNRDRFMQMPEGSFHIEFNKDNPPPMFNLSEPIHVDLSKYINAKFECGFCLKIVDALKQEIAKKGVPTFTEDLQKSCQAQKEGPVIAQTNCDLIDKVKVDRLASESVESICLSEKRCKSQEEITQGNKYMDEMAIANKEEDEMRKKWKVENERARMIVEAQEENWRREFKRKHNDTMEPFKPFLVNLPEGFNEGSGDDNWKPDFGGWSLDNETAVETETTTTAASVDTASVALGSTADKPEAAEVEEEEAEVKKVETAESAPGAKFKPLEHALPTIDFVHEVLEQTVQKEDSAPATSSIAPKGEAETEMEEEPAVVMTAGSNLAAAVASSTSGSIMTDGVESTTTAAASVDTTPAASEEATTVAASFDTTPATGEEGPEPTTLFATTEAPEHFTKSAVEKAGEEQARRTLQEAILEAKKTVDEDVGFMSKPVVVPNREGAAWANGPRVNLHEFVSDHHLGTASSPKATVDAANVGKPETASVEPTISPPVRAPVQCDPPKKATPFSAHPATGQASDAAPQTAAAAAEPEATKLEVAEEQEGPANMAIPRSRQMRVVNRVVNVAFSVDDIAK